MPATSKSLQYYSLLRFFVRKLATTSGSFQELALQCVYFFNDRSLLKRLQKWTDRYSVNRNWTNCHHLSHHFVCSFNFLLSFEIQQ